MVLFFSALDTEEILCIMVIFSSTLNTDEIYHLSFLDIRIPQCMKCWRDMCFIHVYIVTLLYSAHM